MSRLFLRISSASCFLAICAVGWTAAAQDLALPQPGPQHEILARDAGNWKTTVEMMIPGQSDPIVSEGVEENVLVCDGLFVQSKFTGDIAGMAFEGRGLMGYDTMQEKYTGVWVDNFSTSLYRMEGTYDDKEETLTVMMTGVDPNTGEEMTQKHVTTYIDEDTKTFEIYMPDPTGQSDAMVKIMSMRSERQ